MKYDVIIIGGGLSGLTAASLLAKRGLSVAVVEKSYNPGGSCGIFRRGDVTFDQGAAMLYGFGDKGFNAHRFVFNCLEEPIDMIRHDLLYCVNFKGNANGRCLPMWSVDFQPLGVAGIYIDRETGGGCNSQDAEGVRFMTLIIIEFVIVLLGLAVTAVLFYRIPTLPVVNGNLSNYPTISVIIPARNEEHNLPLLLADLSAQTLPNLEIICIDDDSEDSTGQIALENGVKLITLKSKPEGWTGKS